MKCEGELLFDSRVLTGLLEGGHLRPPVEFDPLYVEALPNIAGRTPLNPYFSDPAQVPRRIGWFVGFLDEQSILPRVPTSYQALYRGLDSRIVYRSLPSLIDEEYSIYRTGDRIIPFAALYSENRHPENLQNYDRTPDDSLCFDISTSPHTVVICDGKLASKSVWDFEYEDGPEEEYDLFITPVASSFADFLMLLHDPY